MKRIKVFSAFQFTFSITPGCKILQKLEDVSKGSPRILAELEKKMILMPMIQWNSNDKHLKGNETMEFSFPQRLNKYGSFLPLWFVVIEWHLVTKNTIWNNWNEFPLSMISDFFVLRLTSVSKFMKSPRFFNKWAMKVHNDFIPLFFVLL